MEKFFNKSMFCLIMLFFFVPSPSNRVGTLLRITSMSIYIIVNFLYKKPKEYYIEIFKNLNMSVFSQYKMEISLLIIYAIYELVLLPSQFINAGNLTYTIRPLFYLLLLIFSISYFSKEESNDNIKEILFGIYLVLLIQYAISFLQLFDINIFSFLYDDSKSYPIWRLVRVTGTLGNPNTLAWYICIFTFFIILYEEKIRKLISFVILGLVFTVLTGSRTMLVISPLFWIIGVFVLKSIEQKQLKMLLYAVIAVPIVLIIIYILLTLTKDVFPYASQLLTVFTKGLSSVNSFKLRFIKWDEILKLLNESPINWIFGMNLPKYMSADNDILYGIYRSGLIGLILQYTLYIYMLIKGLKQKTNKRLGFYVSWIVFLSMVVGLQADTLNGWYYPMFIFIFYAGKDFVIPDSVPK